MGFIGVALMALGIIDDFLSWFDIVFIEPNWVSVPMILVGLSLTAAATVCAEFTKVTIPENVEVVSNNTFEDFVNLREAEIWGYIEGVKRSLGTVASLDIDWKDPAVLAEHLRSGCYI